MNTATTEPLTKRTQDEIVARIKTVAKDDFFGFERTDYLECLDYEHAKEFLKEDTTESQWLEALNKAKAPAESIMEYMPFAWDKANNCRGISASRSISHMTAWLWLHGDEELFNRFAQEEYRHYGKEKLIVVCEAFGIDWKALDDGVRTNG